MWAWVIRFAGGLIPGQKPFGEWIGKILYVVAIVLMVSLSTNVWEKFFPAKPSVINVAGDYNAEKRDAAGIGCNLWRAYLKAGVK